MATYLETTWDTDIGCCTSIQEALAIHGRLRGLGSPIVQHSVLGREFLDDRPALLPTSTIPTLGNHPRRASDNASARDYPTQQTRRRF